MKLGIVTYQLGKDWDMPTLIEKLTALRYQGVELRTEAIDVDFLAAQACAGLTGTTTHDLGGISKSCRGPLLSDVDLPENSGFHTWLLGMREDRCPPRLPPRCRT